VLKKLFSLIGAYKLYEKWLWSQIEDGEKLEHIAIILDGNRRWASEKGLNRWSGHKKGAEQVEKLLDWCNRLGVKSITLYAFSTENFRRSAQEIEEIMRIAEEEFRKLLTDERMHRNKVQIKVIGRMNLLPKSLRELIADVEKATEHYDNQFLNIAFAYGGRAEIVDATKLIAERVRNGELCLDEVNESNFEKFLYTSHMPKQDPDLIIMSKPPALPGDTQSLTFSGI
jgi:tritrans,polycis-undecaprenyl-diphosphate synthase [geranylgeranyl-diphosphate specific]